MISKKLKLKSKQQFVKCKTKTKTVCITKISLLYRDNDLQFIATLYKGFASHYFITIDKHA